MKRITERSELQEIATLLGVRPDWHEPDEQEITVCIEGLSFDNAGFWPTSQAVHMPRRSIEMHVIIMQDGVDVAAVNLATLLAWASEKS